MNTQFLASLALAVSSTLAFAAENDPAEQQLRVYPKNLARQHLGSNVFVFNSESQRFVPTEAAAAWLDDDITTGWPAMAGKQYYLVALAEPELVSNFSLSSRPASGTISLYTADEPGAPGSKVWSPLVKDVAFNAVNEKKLAKPFSRLAKYILVETDIADPGPIYSLYLYGEKPALDYTLRQREQLIDTRAIFGPFVNNQTNFSLNGIYTQSRVTSANSPDGFLPWQKGIDDNPESGLILMGSTNESSAAIKYGTPQSLSRIALLTDSTSKGKLDFFAIDAPAIAPAEPGVAAEDAPPIVTGAQAVSLEGLTPTVSIVLDGSNPRTSIDFPAVRASSLLVRWTPVNPADTITIRELNTFGSLSLSAYEVGLKPGMIAQYAATGVGGDGKDAKDAKDGKAIAEGPYDPKDAKIPKEIAAGPRPNYLPGTLGFPPIINNRNIPVSQ